MAARAKESFGCSRDIHVLGKLYFISCNDFSFKTSFGAIGTPPPKKVAFASSRRILRCALHAHRTSLGHATLAPCCRSNRLHRRPRQLFPPDAERYPAVVAGASQAQRALSRSAPHPVGHRRRQAMRPPRGTMSCRISQAPSSSRLLVDSGRPSSRPSRAWACSWPTSSTAALRSSPRCPRRPSPSRRTSSGRTPCGGSSTRTTASRTATWSPPRAIR